jgi:hypothetical protein
MPNWLSFSTANDVITAALLLVLLVFGLLLVALSLQINSNRGHGKSLTINGRCSAKGTRLPLVFRQSNTDVSSLKKVT